MKISYLILIIFCFCKYHCYAQNTNNIKEKILETEIKTLVLTKDALTTGRRSAPVKQLQCISNCDKLLNNVGCTNIGISGDGKPAWKCESDDMPNNESFGDMVVSCEGYENSADVFVLVGSCSLRYSLVNSVEDSMTHLQSKNVEMRQEESDTFNLIVIMLCVVILVCIFIYYYYYYSINPTYTVK